jgi:hypothetical protein
MARRVERDFFYILTAKHGGATNVHGVIEKIRISRGGGVTRGVNVATYRVGSLSQSHLAVLCYSF